MQRRMACHIVKTQLKTPLDVCVHTEFSDSICFLSYKPSLLIPTCAFTLFTSVRHLISWYIWVIEERHALIAAVMLWYFLIGGGSSFVVPFHLLLPSLSLSLSLSLYIYISFSRCDAHDTMVFVAKWAIWEIVGETGHCVLVCAFGSKLISFQSGCGCQIHLQTYWRLLRGDSVIYRHQLMFDHVMWLQ